MSFIEPNEFLTLIKEYWTHITSVCLLGNLLWKKYKYVLLGQDKAQVKKTVAESEGIAAQASALMLDNMREDMATTREILKTTAANLEIANETNLSLKKQFLEDETKHRQELAEKDAYVKKIIEEGLAVAQKLEIIELLNQNGQLAVRRLMQKTGAAYWVTNKDGRAEYISDEFYKFFGVTAETAKDWGRNIVPEDYQRILREFARLLKDRDTYAEMEFSFLSGESAKSYYAIIPEKNGEIHKIIGVTIRL